MSRDRPRIAEQRSWSPIELASLGIVVAAIVYAPLQAWGLLP